MKIPCKDCLLVSVCRHKIYTIFINECILIKEVLYVKGANNELLVKDRSYNFDGDIYKVHQIIQPKKWEPYFDNGTHYFRIHHFS